MVTRIQARFMRNTQVCEPGIGAMRPIDGQLGVVPAMADEGLDAGQRGTVCQLWFQLGQDAPGEDTEAGDQLRMGQPDARAHDAALAETRHHGAGG